MIDAKFKDLTLKDVGKQWLLFNRNSLKKSTLETYRIHFQKHIAQSELSNCPLEDITPEDIVNFSQDLLDRSLSPKSVNCLLIQTHSIFKFAQIMYGFSPPYIRYIKERNKEMRVLSSAEQNKLELYLKSHLDIYNLGILFALYTGVRIGELCALTWGDIQNGAIKINKTMQRLNNEKGKSVVILDEPKTPSSNRVIPLPDFLNTIIEDWRHDDNEFFLSSNRKKRVEPRSIQNRFKSVSKICGINGATFHTLRHTFATRCIECGFDPKTLSEILGHADVKTTLNRYVHSSFELKKNSMNLLTKIAI